MKRHRAAVFVKTRPGTSAAGYAFEAASLAWLAEAEGGCATAHVIDIGTDRLLLEQVVTTAPSVQAAAMFGAALARTHAAGAECFGDLPPGFDHGFIAELPLPSGHWHAFGPFYAQTRLRPFADQARRLGHLSVQDYRAVIDVAERIGHGEVLLCGPGEDPARLHGDLWSANALWRARDVVLIDPSAHGGHRETDLAMLALFGFPFLDVVLEAYQDAWPLAAGWQQRVHVHQLYPLLVHSVLFGGSYGMTAGALARGLLT